MKVRLRLLAIIVVLMLCLLAWLSFLGKAKRENDLLTEGSSVSTVSGSSQAPTNRSSGSKAPVNQSNKLERAIANKNVPIDFWGIVIDEIDAPLPGVAVKAHIRAWRSHKSQFAQGQFSSNAIITDADGRFEITGESGDVLTIDSMIKSGYEPEPNALRSFGYNISTNITVDKDHPIVFRMWKTETKEQLVTGKKFIPIVPDGRTYSIDLLQGTVSDSPESGGDLRVLVRRADDAKWGGRYDWEFKMEVVNGGLVEEPDQFASMYLAPTNGFVRAYDESYRASDQRWSYGTKMRRFYLRTRNGSYARIQVEAYAYYLKDHQGRLDLQYWVNPAGSRILR